MTALAQRLAAVREKIAAAVERRGPGPEVTLCAVAKRHSPEAIRAAFALGVRDFGENYAQELRDKRVALDDLSELRWHAIGPVQSNKIKYVLGAALVHTVDGADVVTKIDARAAASEVVQDVLVQVNVAHEAGKSGALPSELPAVLAVIAACPHVRCRGLMLIPPAGEPEATRPWFRALRQLRDRIAPEAPPGVELGVLSMGMSSDYEVAIEEGATIVRVGTAIFGPRPA